jgi:hypothetical protein
MPLTATIRGLPHNPSIIEINTRGGPSTQYDKPFKAQVGLSGLLVMDVKPDEHGTAFEGKLYQWFELEFPDSRHAWVRDDLLAIQGDGVRFGYDIIDEETFAFLLQRRDVIAPGEEVVAAIPAPAPVPTPVTTATSPTPSPVPAPLPSAPVPAPPPAPTVDDELTNIERIRLAAFNITEGFEGSGYASFQNQDSGIVSYGRFQFTLAGSGLFSVLEKYTQQANSQVSMELRANYLDRTRNHDPNLRHDSRFRELLIQAADDSIMHDAQDEAATTLYWNVVHDLSIKPRGIMTPLGIALIFDMGINFGPRHGFIGAAEREIGVPPRSNLREVNAREEDLIAALARLRKQSHDRQAERDNLPGLRLRGDFWVQQIDQRNWQLEGNDDGLIEVTPDKRVRVRGFFM